VVAWGRGKESWSVDYRVIEGDTARPDVWARLDTVLARDWRAMVNFGG
jgi:phage terminase large subunit GpA-like protein